MRVAARLPDDEELIEPVYEAPVSDLDKAGREDESRPLRTWLRMLVLKHANNRSFDETEHQVRVGVVCRQFARVVLKKYPSWSPPTPRRRSAASRSVVLRSEHAVHRGGPLCSCD
jgi:hypothetical protein